MKATQPNRIDQRAWPTSHHEFTMQEFCGNLGARIWDGGSRLPTANSSLLDRCEAD